MRQKHFMGGWGILLLALMVVCSTLSFGQAVSGDLIGRVTDASGAVVSNATVEAENLGTGQKATSTTNSNGEYRFTNLPAGHYKLTSTGNGLTGGYADVRVDLNKTATANITATVGASATTIEVVEQAATIDTTTAQIQTNYDPKQAQDLPTASVGLGVLNLSLLQAGVASSGGVGSGTGPSVSGQRPRNNNFTIEGVDNNDKGVTGPLVTIPNDAVEQFTVLQNNFSPEFGHSSGGQFNTVVMSGTNKFHGRAYEYFQNRNLNAQDSIIASGLRSNGAPVENVRFDNNRFGGQVGGPILKDKLFFFTNWEYNPIGQVSGGSTACAPTAAGYASLAALPGVNANNLQAMQTYLPAAPTEDTAHKDCKPLAGGIPTGLVGFSGPNFSNTLTTVNSVDFNPTQTDQLRFRYIYSKFSGLDNAAQIPTFWNTLPQRFHVATLSEFHTFSPKVTNEFRLGFNRFLQDFVVPNIPYPGGSLAAFPNITLDDLAGVNIGPDPNAPQGTFQNFYQLADNVSVMKGKHNIKFGIEGRKYISPQTFTQRVRGDYEYSSTSRFLQDLAPDTFGERSTGDPIYAGDQYAIYAFGNDEWRVTNHLTLNLGLRYEFTKVPAAYALQTLNSVSTVPGLLDFSTAPTSQKKNFAPRVGFAYSPGSSGNTSIRGGFAMAYDVIYDNLGLLSLPPQLSSTCDANKVTPPTAACPYSTTAFLANGGLPAGGSGLATFPDAATARASTSAFIPNQKLPYSESWNIGVQHIFAKKYIAEVRYVGTRGLHLPVQTHINQFAVTNASNALPTYFSNPGQGSLDGLTSTLDDMFAISNITPAFENAGFTNPITSFQPFGSSIYHGLQTQLTRNFTNGLQFQAAWTWSHMFDNSTADVFSTLLTPRRPQDYQNVNADMSTSALDRRHRVTVQLIYDLPFYKKDSNWFKKNVIGNWELAPIYTFQSPEYYTPQSGYDANMNGDTAPDRTIINPNGVGITGSGVNPLFNTAGSLVAWCTCDTNNAGLAFDPNIWGFDPQTTNPNARFIQAGFGTIATGARNSLPLPRINSWDLTAVKRFSIREGMNFEFQAQALNVFNHAQYVPGSLNQINSLGFTGANTLNYVRVNSAAFNNARAAFSNQPRAMQLALKFTF